MRNDADPTHGQGILRVRRYVDFVGRVVIQVCLGRNKGSNHRRNDERDVRSPAAVLMRVRSNTKVVHYRGLAGSPCRVFHVRPRQST
jgi:hypothetical protein